MRRRVVGLFLKLGITAGLLLYLFATKVRVQDLIGAVKGLSIPLIGTALLLYAFAQLLSTFRWKVLLRSQGLNVSIWRLYGLYFVGMFFNLFLPTTIGGDVVRAYDLFRSMGRSNEVIASIFLERLSGLVALVLLAVVALGVGKQGIQKHEIHFFVLGILGLVILVIISIFTKRLFTSVATFLRARNRQRAGAWIESVHNAIYSFRGQRSTLYGVLALAFLVQIINVMVYYAIARCLGLFLSPGIFFLFVPLITVISIMPVTISGLGLREATSIFFFGKVGVNPSDAFLLSMLWFFIVVLLSLIGGIIFIVRGFGSHAPGGYLKKGF
jgi:uncharacterized protein (TIRG00374 family)